MKILNKQELQQIVFNYSSNIDFKDFMNFTENHMQNYFLFLVIDTTLASDNPLRFWNNLLARISRLITTIDDKIRDEKLQYGINRKEAKISALSSGKIHKYEYLTS